jgi:exopolysaccharide production protein ExoZ
MCSDGLPSTLSRSPDRNAPMPPADFTVSRSPWPGRLARAAASLYEVPAASARLAPLEGLRAYAAFLVFLVHYCDSYATVRLGIDPNTLRLGTVPDINTGLVYYLFASHYGVDLFFFLSGFLICRIVARPAFDYAEFALQRFLRVYPAFLASLAVWASIRIGAQHWYALDGRQLLGNLLFLNAVPALGVMPYNTVTWSLFFEFVFYLSFPLVLSIGRPRRVTPLRIALFAGLFMSMVLQLGGFFIRFLMFFGGALLAVLPQPAMTRLARRIPDGVAIALHVGAATLFATLLDYPYFIPVFLVSTFVLVVKLLHGHGPLHGLFGWTPLRYLGNVSYSFYLVHGLGVEFVMRWHHDLFRRLDGVAYVLITVVASLLVGVVIATALFLAAEKPYFAWRRRSSAAAAGVVEPGMTNALP